MRDDAYVNWSVIDLPCSYATKLVLQSGGSSHSTGHDQHCNDMVYLLFEGANNPVAATESDTIVRLYEDTKTYVGQTVNFRARDSSRRYVCHG